MSDYEWFGMNDEQKIDQLILKVGDLAFELEQLRALVAACPHVRCAQPPDPAPVVPVAHEKRKKK